jgi:hypothetical protein
MTEGGELWIMVSIYSCRDAALGGRRPNDDSDHHRQCAHYVGAHGSDRCCGDSHDIVSDESSRRSCQTTAGETGRAVQITQAGPAQPTHRPALCSG